MQMILLVQHVAYCFQWGSSMQLSYVHAVKKKKKEKEENGRWERFLQMVIIYI